MNSSNNENGYALLMVMLLVVLFTILGMGLLAMNINASKQFNKKEEQVQARHFAEMGVLHYKAEIQKELSENQNRLANKHAFCERVKNLSSKVAEENYKILSRDCSVEEDQITITFISEGNSGINETEEIGAELYVEPQEGPPLKPTVPAGANREWPACAENPQKEECEVSEFTVVSEVEMQKEDLLFKDHLIIDKLNINGGSKANLTVDKDFYVEDSLVIQNHACIIVQGNLTVTNSITSKDNEDSNNLGTHTYIFVYGDANLPANFMDLKNKSGIYVLGDVYINSVKEENPIAYQPFPTGDSYGGCVLPGENDYESPKKWALNEEIVAEYH